MEKNVILNFKQDDEFYFKLGKECLQNGEYFRAIKYLQKAISLIKGDNEFLTASYQLILAQAYALANYTELSNYYYFACLDCDIFAQIAFRGLGENFVKQNDNIVARFYLNQCINLMETSALAQSAKIKLETLKDKNYKGFKVVGKDGKVFNQTKLEKAEQYMSQGKFDKAIPLFEEYGNMQDEKVRGGLSLAYFFINENKKAIEVIEQYGQEDNVLDLCNLLLIYHCENQTEKFESTKEKLRRLNVKRDEDNFKIGLAFAQINELEKAKLYMEKFLSVSQPEPELEFLYCLTCINSKDYETANKKLIELKALDPYKNYFYNYYLNVCKNKNAENLSYEYCLPAKDFLYVQKKAKEYLLTDDNTLLEEFLANQDLFYFIVTLPDTNTKNLLLLKLAKIADKRLNNFFKYVLLNNEVTSTQKEKIVLARLSTDVVTSISLVRDRFYTKITIPYVVRRPVEDKIKVEEIQRLIDEKIKQLKAKAEQEKQQQKVDDEIKKETLNQINAEKQQEFLTEKQINKPDVQEQKSVEENNENEKIKVFAYNEESKSFKPEEKKMQPINPVIRNATINCVEFLLLKTGAMNINLKRPVIKLERKLLNDEVNESVVSAYLSWMVASKQKLARLRDICAFFNITQAEFYDFANKYGFEV